MAYDIAPWAPLGSRLWDLKTIPLHIHFPNEVFHLLLILPILYNAHCALDRNLDLHVSKAKGNNDDLANPLDSVCAPSCCILHGDNFSTFCEPKDKYTFFMWVTNACRWRSIHGPIATAFWFICYNFNFITGPPFMTYNVNRNCIARWAFEYLILLNFVRLMLKEVMIT